MADPLPRRPKIWIHRTRRFWFGLLLLVLLTAYLILTGFFRAAVAHRSARSSSGGSVRYNEIELEAGDGGLQLTRARSHVGPSYVARGWGRLHPSAWTFQTFPSTSGVKWLPSLQLGHPLDLTDDLDQSTTRVFLPAWPLIALLCILWPLHLHRADLKEARRLARSHPPLAPEVGDEGM